MMVTATFGRVAAGRAIGKLVAGARRPAEGARGERRLRSGQDGGRGLRGGGGGGAVGLGRAASVGRALPAG